MLELDPGSIRQTHLSRIDWPARSPIIGVSISRTNYDEAAEAIMKAAHAHRSSLVTAFAVHGVVEARRDPILGRAIERFDLVTPDGQPVRHALNLLYGAGLSDRVYGPTLMLRLCERAAAEGVGIYLYGSKPETVERVARALEARFPGLRIVGAEPSLFRPLTREESDELVERVTRSGAGLMFIGLGCPRQEHFAASHRGLIPAVMICVGAAFDFHSGTQRQAPPWMQKASLEWLFRLVQEPRRLFRRYMVTNSYFLRHLALQFAASRIGSGR